MSCWKFYKKKMGALTLKTFPFELRGWEIEKFDGLDVTDAFAIDIKLCLINKRIIQIEPSHNNSYKNQHFWLNDKSRQFFDSFTSTKHKTSSNNFKKTWNGTVKSLQKTIYLFNLCDLKHIYTHFFIIIYENLDTHLFYLLNLYCKKFNFVKLKKAETRLIKNNLESSFLTSKNLTFNKLKNSSLCLLVSTNTRLEGSILNLNLKQRVLKGNFKCFIIGSLLNLSFNSTFIGKTTANVLKSINEGTHFICQDIKLANNPFLIVNSELLKRKDYFSKILKKLNYVKFNTLNLSVFEPGILFSNKIENLNGNDLLQFSSLFFINLTSHSKNSLNKIIKTNLIYLNYHKKPFLKKNFYNQNFFNIKDLTTNLSLKKKDNYVYIPVKTVFGSKNTFLSTNGFVKHTNNLIKNNETKSGWKILRNIFNNLKKNLVCVNSKIYFKTTVTSHKHNNFSKFINLNVYPTRSLENKTVTKNLKPFQINKKNNFKIKKIKFSNTKMKFWLNDFFTGGKDEFSKNSLIMVKSSNIKRLESTNFF